MNDELKAIREKKANAYLNQESMPKTIVNLHTADDYYKLVADYPGKGIIIDFWAVWCGPCKMFAPTFKKLQEEYYNDFIFAKVNVDSNPVVAQNFMISSIPTTLFLKGGKLVNKVVGAMNYDRMKSTLEQLKSM